MDDIQSRRDTAHSARQRIIDRNNRAGRLVLTDEDDAEFRRLTDVVNDADFRLAEEKRTDAVRSYSSKIFSAATANTTERNNIMPHRDTASDVYTKHSALRGRSFWADLVRMKSGDDADGSARRRLAEHAAARGAHGADHHGQMARPFQPARVTCSISGFRGCSR